MSRRPAQPLLLLLAACSTASPANDAGPATPDAQPVDARAPAAQDAQPDEPDAQPAQDAPDAGVADPDPQAFRAFDDTLEALMRKWEVPGLAVAVTQGDRLVLARAYGVADRDTNEPLRPDALFRIASVSKPITSAAVMRLVEQGRLRLDQPVFALLDHLQPPAGATVDPRLASITVRHLLEHSAGWDRAKSGDPMFKSREIARDMGVTSPPSPEVIIRWMMGRPLDFTPGAEFQYSNFGYCVLGRVIEKVTGKTYERHLREDVLAPLGVTRMRIGRTHLADRAEGEVRYHGPAGEPTAPSVFPDDPAQVPFEYGAFALEPLDSHGGWIASTIDLLRVVTALDGDPTRPDMLTPATRALIAARPSIPAWRGMPAWYGLGWLVRPVLGGGENWWHSGSLPGTTTLLVKTAMGFSWVALANTRPTDFGAFDGELDTAMWQAFNSVPADAWPATDAFAAYP